MNLRGKWVIAAKLGMTSLICLASVVGGCGVSQDYYEKLMRADPSEMDSSDRAVVVRYVLCPIQDGYGRKAKTPWSESYLDYYIRVVGTTPLDSSSSIVHLHSGTHMPAGMCNNAAEALVQEGYGQRVCEALLVAARGWEKQKRASRRERLRSLECAYEAVIELKFRMYLHSNKDLLRRLAVIDRLLLGASVADVLSDKASKESSSDAVGWLAAVDRRMADEGFQLDYVDSEEVREELLPRLKAMNDETFNEAYSGWLRARRERYLGKRYDQARLVSFYTRLLRDGHDTLTATAALGTMGPGAKAGVPALIEVMQDKSRAYRFSAARALGEIGPAAKEAVPALIQALNEDDANLHMCAADALGEIGPAAKAAVPALVRNLREDKQVFPVQAARALAKIGPEAKAAVAALIHALKHKNELAAGRAAWALVKIESGAGETVPALTRALSDKDPVARALAAFALEWIGPKAKKAVPALVEALGDEHKQVRCEAARALGTIGPPAKAAIPALREALKDENAKVRKAAAEALKKIQEERATTKP